MDFKLDHSQFDVVKAEMEVLIKWTNDNMRHPTIKVKPQNMKAYLKVIVGAIAIEDIRTLQQQNRTLIEGIDRISDGLMPTNKAYRSLQDLLKSLQGGSSQ